MIGLLMVFLRAEYKKQTMLSIQLYTSGNSICLRLLTCCLFFICFTQSGHAQYSFEEVSRAFLGKPYVASTLDRDTTEKLVINTNEVDCTTFLEYVVAGVTAREIPDSSNSKYREAVQKIRYRNGKIYNYASRLHYFSEWLAENRKNGLIYDVTDSLGGRYVQKQINFMSTHPAAYPAFLRNPALLDSIKITERALSETSVYILPKERIESAESLINTGDLIAITTAIDGLDITHVGFAQRVNGRIHLLHASSVAKKVIIDPLPLAAYLQKQKNATGIRVFRITCKS
ncbi:MAG: DUF1460 domain-containing protein [Bacteroidales bacterium]